MTRKERLELNMLICEQEGQAALLIHLRDVIKPHVQPPMTKNEEVDVVQLTWRAAQLAVLQDVETILGRGQGYWRDEFIKCERADAK